MGVRSKVPVNNTNFSIQAYMIQVLISFEDLDFFKLTFMRILSQVVTWKHSVSFCV